MKSSNLTTPVLLIVFNRPGTTRLVFDAIRKVKPDQLYVASDGPRQDHLEDKTKCIEVRKIIKRVDWPCRLKTLFQSKNLGCGLGPVTAINWFFKNVEQGIILEDDCLPNQSFFFFCQELLDRYKDNIKIMHISGNNFQFKQKRGNGSYYFSNYTHNWGWATWRRAWKFNNFKLISKEKRRHIWDKQWLISVKQHHGLAILPNVNLVTNIGLGVSATHTTETSQFLNLPTEEIKFPLIHPKKISQNLSADLFTYRYNFNGRTRDFIVDTLVNKIKNS